MPKASKSKSCFVICPIGEKGSPNRRRSDQVLKHIITPAVKGCGYKAVRADMISEPGNITRQIIQRLIEDDLVIADLTGHNPNVFYELAIRHMVKLPLVQIIKEGERIPFDVASSRTIQFNHEDLDSAEYCRMEITRQIQSIEMDPTKMDNPISIAIDTESLRQSGNPVEKGISEIMQLLLEIRTTQEETLEHITESGKDIDWADISASFVVNQLVKIKEILALEKGVQITEVKLKEANAVLEEAIDACKELQQLLGEIQRPTRYSAIRIPKPRR